jgi:hypothetical protein
MFERKVAGAFEESFIVHSSGPFVVALDCGGPTLIERTVRYGKDVGIDGEVELGSVAL